MTTSNTLTKTDLANILNEIVAIDGTDMTSQEIDDFVDSLNITGINAVDYVVEQGSSGNWSWTKWNSGKCEMWYRGNIGNVTLGTQLGTDYVSSLFHVDFPFSFTSVPSCVVGYEGSSTGYAWVQYSSNERATASRSYGIRLARIATASITLADVIITCHAIGKWK